MPTIQEPSTEIFSTTFNIDHLIGKIANTTTKEQRQVVKKAYRLAEDAHKFQKRLSGEPYIIHPLSVAYTLSDYLYDYESICAALLHDVLEDTNISHEFMTKEFGIAITNLVDGVTKISMLKSQSTESKQAINIRKMILATTEDIRVILIKLADKMHNMSTLKFQPEVKQKRISQEVIDIYAPLAGRLGIYKIKSDLEDLALSYLNPLAYQKIKENVAEKKQTREKRIKLISNMLTDKFKELNIKVNVKGRSKHFNSIYNKLIKDGKSFNEIYDLAGIRVLVENVQTCYNVLGIVHTLWTPIPGRFKDYISVPKSNGYQSLHTTVIGPQGKALEVQIRTDDMHQVAEYGVAAHWSYKEEVDPSKVASDQDKLLQSTQFLHDEDPQINDPSTFLEELKSNLENDEIYVFTPKGDIISLPLGSTVLDFAFRIHTDLGLKCAGARIEDRLVSIRTKIKSGDQVYITVSSQVNPSTNWLKFLKTSHARSKLKNYFNRNGIQYAGSPNQIKTVETTKPVEQEPSKKAIKVVSTAPPKRKLSQEIDWNGESNFEAVLAQCCQPNVGERIRGYITKTRGLSVHKAKCPALLSLLENEENKDRIVNITWKGLTDNFKVEIKILANDRYQLFADLVSSLAQAGVNILSAVAKSLNDTDIEDTFTIEADSQYHLETIQAGLEKVESVLAVDYKKIT